MKYLKGLDTLRALAAFVVLFDHTEIIKQRNKLYNLLDNPSLIYPDGHLSVMLFFVISGFSYHLSIAGRETENRYYQYKKFLY